MEKGQNGVFKSEINRQLIFKSACAALAIILIVGAALFCSPSLVVNASNPTTADMLTEGASKILQWTPYDGECECYAVYVDQSLVAYTTDAYIDVTAALTAGREYVFTVYAVNNGIETEISSLNYANYVQLSCVTGIEKSEDGITWNAVKNAKSYSVYADDVFLGDADATFFALNDFLAESKTYRITVLPNGANEYYLLPQKTDCTFDYEFIRLDGAQNQCLYVSNVAGALTASWEPQPNAIKYFYDLINGQTSVAVLEGNTLSNELILTDKIENGVAYELNVTALMPGGLHRVLGNTTFTVTDGEVEYA